MGRRDRPSLCDDPQRELSHSGHRLIASQTPIAIHHQAHNSVHFGISTDFTLQHRGAFAQSREAR